MFAGMKVAYRTTISGYFAPGAQMETVAGVRSGADILCTNTVLVCRLLLPIRRQEAWTNGLVSAVYYLPPKWLWCGLPKNFTAMASSVTVGVMQFNWQS
jgi:hypothetical protein